jgi:hypothetical protein
MLGTLVLKSIEDEMREMHCTHLRDVKLAVFEGLQGEQKRLRRRDLQPQAGKARLGCSQVRVL